jgi:hypothetical protein
MKKHLKLFLFIISLFTVLFNINAVNAATKWETKTIDVGSTSEGITKKIVTQKKGDYYYFSEVIYTIPENYNGDSIIINAGDDMIDALNDKTYVPGDASDCKITIINKSKYSYSYINNSFYVSTENYTKYYKLGYANKLASTEGDVTVFDGNILPQEYTTLRTKDSAIVSLYNARGTENIIDKQVTDASLDTKLKEKGYTNGIKDLNKYFLDFYNAKYNTTATVLEDLPNKAIVELTAGNVNGSGIKETNAEVANLTYNYFYNHLITISPISENSTDDAYSVGSLMRDYNSKKSTGFEKYYRNAFGEIKTTESKTVEGFVMNINGPDTDNAYQSYNFGFTLGFKLNAKEGKVIAHYIDNTGKTLHSDITSNGKVTDPYQTKALEIAGYELIKTSGNETGSYVDGTIEVTYVYEYVMGEGDVTTPTTPVIEVLPPNTGID